MSPGIPIDGKTVFTSDHALKLDWIPDWIAIIGSGYIGLEFSDVYTALGSDVTFIEVFICDFPPTRGRPSSPPYMLSTPMAGLSSASAACGAYLLLADQHLDSTINEGLLQWRRRCPA